MKKPLALLCAAAVIGAVAVPAVAKTEKAGAKIRWAHASAAAIDEMKERGCAVVATFHSEHWGPCNSQDQLVFGNDDFIAWANENIVCVVGHNGAVGGKEDHQPVEETDAKTKEKRTGVCPRYHGLLCEEHQKVASDAHAGADGRPTVPGADGVPNTWLIVPSGDVTEIKGTEKMNGKALMESVTATLKKLDPKPIPYKKWQDYTKSIADGDKALVDAKWKVALAAYLKVDADSKKLSKPLAEKVKAKVEAANTLIVARFEEIKGGTDDDATKLKAVKALRADVGAKFSTGTLAVVADLDAFVKAAAPPAK